MDLTSSQQTKSQNSFATIYFLLLGGASGCGWNAGINSLDYFAAKYPRYNVQFVFPLAPYIAQLFTVLLITKLSGKFSFNTRMIASLIIIMIITGLLPFEAALFKDTAHGVFIILGLLFILGFNNSLCYTSLAGLASQIEGKYTAYFLIGTGINSLAMSFLKQATLSIFDSSSEEEMMNISVYFFLTLLYLLSCMLLHSRFMKSEFYKTHFKRSPQAIDQEKDLAKPLNGSIESQIDTQRDFKTMMTVFKEVKFYVILLIICYAQLIMCIPGLMLKKQITNMANHTKTTSMLIVFNLFFIAGKKLGQYRQYYNKHILALVILLRFMLVGFFYLQAINVQIGIFESVWFGYLNIALFGLSMGFVNVGLFILGPEKVKPHNKEIAGFLSVLGANVGLILGAVLALPFRNVGISHSH